MPFRIFYMCINVKESLTRMYEEELVILFEFSKISAEGRSVLKCKIYLTKCRFSVMFKVDKRSR